MVEDQLKLEPCPFCGRGNYQVSLYTLRDEFWTIGCGACGSHFGRNKDKQSVIDGWNNRPNIPMRLKQVGWYGPESMPDKTGELRLWHSRPNSRRHGNWPACPVYVVIPEETK